LCAHLKSATFWSEIKNLKIATFGDPNNYEVYIP
jgi:hypothetical protein